MRRQPLLLLVPLLLPLLLMCFAGQGSSTVAALQPLAGPTTAACAAWCWWPVAEEAPDLIDVGCLLVLCCRVPIACRQIITSYVPAAVRLHCLQRLPCASSWSMLLSLLFLLLLCCVLVCCCWLCGKGVVGM